MRVEFVHLRCAQRQGLRATLILGGRGSDAHVAGSGFVCGSCSCGLTAGRGWWGHLMNLPQAQSGVRCKSEDR